METVEFSPVREDPGETTIFVYDAAGKLIGEYSTVVAAAEDARVAYLTADHLGSPRINTDRDGKVTSRHDYHPYGEEIITTQRTSHEEYTPDSVRKQFTGYERDGESGLDFAQARMYKYSLGRFHSIDPDNLQAMLDISDPQSWNGYVYVNNQPTRLADPTGKCGWKFWQCIANKWNGYGFRTDAEVEAEYQKRLEFVRVAEEHNIRVEGQPDVGQMSRRQVWDNAETIRSYIQTHGLGMQDTEVDVGPDGGQPVTPDIILDPLSIPGSGGTQRPNNVRSKMPKAPPSLQRVGRAIKWGQGEQGALSRLQSLTRQDVINSGVTRAEAEAARDFYRGVAKADPLNRAAPVRAELMQKVVDLLAHP